MHYLLSEPVGLEGDKNTNPFYMFTCMAQYNLKLLTTSFIIIIRKNTSAKVLQLATNQSLTTSNSLHYMVLATYVRVS